jgi:hypothetical protein
MILTEASFKIIRDNFGKLSTSQVEGLNFLVLKMEEAGFTYPEAAYGLATVYIETAATFQPVIEYGSQAYLKSKKYYPYIGYGYVQLTWKANYERVGKLIGVDLIKDPKKALEPEIAAKIMTGGMLNGWFTGVGFRRKRPVSKYNEIQYKAARNIINGSDRATEIAKYAMIFEKALRS